MNSKSTVVFLLSIGLLTATSAGATQPVLSPGRWEITIKSTQGGITSTSVTEVCITQAVADRLEPAKRKTSDDCQIADGVMKGNRLKYDVKCGPKNKNANTKAEFTYNFDTYEGVVEIKTDDFEAKQIHTAKRLGECETE